MPNRNYQKGRRKEYKLVNESKAKGLLAFRSAGSHSKVDVCVIDLINKQICFYQCKPDNMSELAKKRLEEELKELNNQFKCFFKVV